MSGMLTTALCRHVLTGKLCMLSCTKDKCEYAIDRAVACEVADALHENFLQHHVHAMRLGACARTDACML